VFAVVVATFLLNLRLIAITISFSVLWTGAPSVNGISSSSPSMRSLPRRWRGDRYPRSDR
jgi:hypothetical protein